MSRRLSVLGLVALGALLLQSPAAPAAEDLLKLTPNDALGLVTFNHLAVLDAKLQALGSHMQLPVPGLLTTLVPLVGTLESFDRNANLGLLVLPAEEGSIWPTLVTLVPVVDYARFVGGLQAEDATQPITKIKIKNAEMWARNIGGYAAIVHAEHRAVLEHKLTLATEVPAVLKPWQSWLVGKDIAGVILMPGIKELSAKVQMGIGFAKMATASQANEQAKAAAGIFDAYARMVQTMEQEVLAAGFEVQLNSRQVLRLGSRTLLKPGGSLARAVGQARPTGENLLAGLPAVPFAVAGGGAVSGVLLDEMRKVSLTMMSSAPDLYGLKPAQLEKLTKLSMRSMEHVQGMAMLCGGPADGKAAFSNVVGVMRVDKASAFLHDYEANMREYADLIREAHSQVLLPPTFENCKIDGLSAFKLTTPVAIPQANMRTPQQTQMLERMFGPGAKVTAWIALADEHHAALGYVNQDLLRKTLDTVRQGQPGLAGDPAVAKTAALLPKGAVAVVFISPAGMLRFVQEMAAAAIPPEAKVKLRLPAFPATPPLGWALTTGANEVQTCLIVPPEVLRAIGPYSVQVKAAQSGAKP